MPAGWLTVSSIAFLLAACGGGGGAGSSVAAPPLQETGTHGPAPSPNPDSMGQDPLFPQQWHLKNTGQTAPNGGSASPGQDIRAEPAWGRCNGDGSCKGEGVTIAVVDSGIEIFHPDLQPNISTSLKHRIYQAGGPADGDPTPSRTGRYNAHGTMVSGIIAARDNNGLGGRGVAPRATLLGYRLAEPADDGSFGVQDLDIFDALTYQAQDVAISNNSWGCVGRGRLCGPGQYWYDAIDFGIANGRGARGTIYVWANGNEGAQSSSNYDGAANYRGVIAVAAVDAEGKKAPYSERGANVWVSAPAGTSCRDGLAIVTTDLSGTGGANTGSGTEEIADADYTRCMNGTSAAAPMVSGVVALMLQANPSLGWRDVRAILAQTARQNHAAHPDWTSNGAGHPVNHSYGFGVANAQAAVEAALSWSSLPAQRMHESEPQPVNLAIPDNNPAGISSSITISNSGISRIEWVDIHFSASDHPYSGDLSVLLVSPSGTQSVLAEPHLCGGSCSRYNGWRFGIARHLNEPADGTWQLIVKDEAPLARGTFQSWKITLYGH